MSPRSYLNLQVSAAPDGPPPWVSGLLRDSIYDLAVARIWSVIWALADQVARGG